MKLDPQVNMHERNFRVFCQLKSFQVLILALTSSGAKYNLLKLRRVLYPNIVIIFYDAKYSLLKT